MLVDGIRLAEPSWLWLSFAMPFVLLAWRRPCASFTETWVAARSNTFKRMGLRSLISQAWLRLLALSMLILALSRPQIYSKEDLISEGIDIALVFDVSSSMRFPFESLVSNPADGTNLDKESDESRVKTKFTEAKKVLQAFVAKRGEDRLALLSFARSARLETPLTLDHDAVGTAIEALLPVAVKAADDGTAIGLALALCAYAFESSESASKVAILLTDGENNREEVLPSEGVALCQEKGVRVNIVSVQSDDDVVSGLRELAKSGGGDLYVAQDPERLNAIYDEIDRLEKTRLESESGALPWRDISAAFVVFAMASVLIEIVVRRAVLRSWS